MKTLNAIIPAVCFFLISCEKSEMLRSPSAPITATVAIIKPDFSASIISQNKTSEEYLMFLKQYNADPMTPYFGEVWLDDKSVYKIDGSITYDNSRNVNIRFLEWQFLDFDNQYTPHQAIYIPPKQRGVWIYLIEPASSNFRFKLKLTAHAKSDSASIVKWIPESLINF